MDAGYEVGPYRLLFLLGKGGMGEVWAAELAKSAGFSKVVALKVVPAPSFEATGVVMFIDEAKASAALSHPAIVPTFDFGTDSGTAYIAMELVRGPSLNVLLGRLSRDGRRMSPAVVTFIGERIATALDYAYRRAMVDGRPLRLIHRDVSPQNILVDAHGLVRLSDFGIARTTIQSHATRAGIFRGKPGYLSPEQILGRELDDRSDVFALGVVLYECAASARCFGAASVEESLDSTLDEDPVLLHERVKGFPAELSLVIQRALGKEPAERQDSTGRLAEALSAIGRSLPDFGTAEQSLGDLVRTTFSGDDFDVESRIADAIAAHEATRIKSTRSLRRPEWPSLGPNSMIPVVEAEDTAEDPPIDTAMERFLKEASTTLLGRTESRGPIAFAALAVTVAMLGAIYVLISRTEAVEPAPTAVPERSAPVVATPRPVEQPPPPVTPIVPLEVLPPARPPEVQRRPAVIDAGASVAAVAPSVRAWRAIQALDRLDPREAGRMKVVYAEAVAAGDQRKLDVLAEDVERKVARR